MALFLGPAGSRAGLCLLGALALTACGEDAEFGGPSARGADNTAGLDGAGDAAEPPVDDPVDPSRYASLTWYWQCATDPGVPPAGTDADPVVEGEGPHTLPHQRLVGTPVTVRGRLCPPAQLPRDIIFVIDTSGSMGGSGANDPRVGNSCGRLKAVESVVASTSPGTARFAVATFSSGLDATSSGLFDTQDGLFANLAPGGDIADVLCADNGNTNYNAGLAQAQKLLKGGRSDATKEVYLISDGQPSGGQDGVAVAQTLKTIGVNIGTEFIPVTIATVMLSGADTVLESKIASRDAKGKPLHAYVAQTGELTKVLTELARNEIVSAELSWRPIGASEWTALNLMTNLQGYDFTLPPFTIEEGDGASGLEVLFEYRDLHDHRVATGGKILWSTAEDGADE